MARRRRKPTTRLTTGRPALAESSGLDAVLAGTALDGDEHLYRPLTGSRADNLPAFQQERAIAIAKYLFRSNPVGNRYIWMFTDFVLGEGATLAFKNAAVEAVITRHWRDAYNDWERAQVDLFQTWLIFGELLLPLFPNEVDGHLRIGVQLPENIRGIAADPENWRVVRAARMKAQDGAGAPGEGKVYTVVNLRDDREELLRAEAPALFWSRGNPFGNRGLSLLYSIADLLDLMDQFIFSEVERAFLLKAFVWDVTVNNATPEDLARKAAEPQYGPPKPGSVRLHNEQETWTAVSPELDTADAWNGITKLRNHTGGALGIPEHWFAEGGDVNRATAAEMDAPTLKRMTQVQREWRRVVLDVLHAQIDYAILRGVLPEEVALEREGQATGETLRAHDAVELILPDLSPSDNAEQVTTLAALINAVGLAVEHGNMSWELGTKLVLTQAQALGIELDVAQELEAARQEKAARDAERETQVERLYAQRPPVQLASRRVEDAERGRGAPAAGD